VFEIYVQGSPVCKDKYHLRRHADISALSSFVITSYVSMCLKSRVEVLIGELTMPAYKLEISSVRHIVMIDGYILIQYRTFGSAGMI
jgi:hypothetical protein